MSTVLERSRPEGTLARWWPWLAVAAGLALLYVPTYIDLARGLWRDDAYAHGPIIVAVFAWLVWRNRAALLEGSGNPSPILGGALVAFGLLLYVVGRSQALTLFEVASHLPVIAGALLVMRGPRALRRFAFPVLFLFFLIPLPGFILDTVTTPLKNVVSVAVAGLLQVLGYPVERAGVVLTVGQYEMLVADACSGLNSLYSLFALSFLYVHLTGNQAALRGPGPSRPARIAVLLLSLIPIAIVANIVRVMVLVLVTYHAGPEAAQGWVHDAAGMAVFVIALGLVLAADRLFGKARIARPETAHATADGAAASSVAAIFLLVALSAAAVAAPALEPAPADVSAVNLEKMLPRQFDGWRVDPTVEPIAPAPDVQANLERIYNQTVSRAYVNDAGEQMMLTVAYGGDQSDALKAHRQEVCYSAQGFAIHGLHHGSLDAAGRTIPVTRLHAVRGARSEPVTYWLTMGDRVVLGRLERLKVQLASGLAGRLPDGMLVRVSSIGDDLPRAYSGQQSFIAGALAAMPAADAARLVGDAMTTFAAPTSNAWIANAWNAGWIRQLVVIGGFLFLGVICGTLVAVAGLAAVLLFVAVLACAFILRDFRVGVGLLMVIMPIAQSYAFPHAMFGITGLNPLNLLLATTLGVYFMRAAGSGSVRHLIPWQLFALYLVPLTMGAAIGTLHVHEIPAAYKAMDMIFFDNAVGYVRDMLLKPLSFVIYALLIGAAVWRSKEPERFVTPLLVSVWVMAALIIGFVIASGVPISYLAGSYSRAFYTPLGMHANDLGRLYVVGYALLLFIWDRVSLKDDPTLKMLLFASMGLAAGAMVLTFSRGAFLGFVIVNAIYILSRANWKTFMIVGAALPPFLYFLPGAVWSRLQAGKGEGADAVSAGRIDGIWGPIMPEIFDHPFLGNGLGSIMYSKAVRSEQIDLVAHPHNAFLELYLNMGVAGLVLVLAFWAWTWWRFRKLARDMRVHPRLQGLFEGAAAGLVSFLVAGFAGSSLQPAAAQAFLWLAIGLMFGISLQLKYGTKYRPGGT